jgi:hypothetical protein
VLVDVLRSGDEGFNLRPAVDMLAEQGGIAFFRYTGCACNIIVTWSLDPIDVWLARWRAAVGDSGEVSVVDDVPID